MEILLTQEQIDVLSSKSTKSMHEEFESFGESALKESFPAITSGMVRHVQMQLVDMLVEDGNVWIDFLGRVRELRQRFVLGEEESY